MDHQQIQNLKEKHPSIRLLNADNSPLIISFLYHKFKENNISTISKNELESNLSDYLFHLRKTEGSETYPKTPSEYLEDWTNANFLRSYYSSDDVAYFDITHYTEKALEWIRDLVEERKFVATESRLLKIISTLKEIAYENTDDPTEKLAELEKQKREIETQIDNINAGIIEKLSETQIKERYFEICDTIHKMLSEFGEIEYNFKQLDMEIREKQIKDGIKKDKILHDIFFAKDQLKNTDQGRSLDAFWELLLSSRQQDELDKLIEMTLALPEVRSIKNDDTLEEMKIRLIRAGDRVNKINYSLAEQLRKFLDERVYLENKKIIGIIKDIKSNAVEMKNNSPDNNEFITLESKPIIEMIMDRPLWKGSSNTKLRKPDMKYGSPEEVNTSVLYNQFNIDPKELKDRIQEFLKTNTQITLRAIVEKYPVNKGLVEILTYIDIAAKNKRAVINENVSETFIIWNATSKKHFKIEIPQVIFCRSEI
ncbi:DUF3375 domain-containing protein [Methanolobus psychrotolerans]|uniref:DUF3375 domain-containing protein n=1 Tax=Methanolobus psychrotolerans TaxID=1874706 RepID=UPI000B91936D|nr:DUF3375 domain-containing protein [Methanolobus psychrotolerans]